MFETLEQKKRRLFGKQFIPEYKNVSRKLIHVADHEEVNFPVFRTI